MFMRTVTGALYVCLCRGCLRAVRVFLLDTVKATEAMLQDQETGKRKVIRLVLEHFEVSDLQWTDAEGEDDGVGRLQNPDIAVLGLYRAWCMWPRVSACGVVAD